GRLDAVSRGLAEGWGLGGRQQPFSEFDCHYGSPRKWQAPSARRSLCRRERTAGRLLHHRRARPRCRNLLGISVPGRGSWRRRGACFLGGVGVSGALVSAQLEQAAGATMTNSAESRHAPEMRTLLTGLAMGESPRWHENRLWV